MVVDVLARAALGLRSMNISRRTPRLSSVTRCGSKGSRYVIFVMLVGQAFSPSGSGLARSPELWSVLPRCHAVVPSRMEDSMCYEIDYQVFAAQKKAQEARIKQVRRAGVVDQLLTDANRQGEDTKTKGIPVNEVVPAK
jgi:hypothetical protein